MICDTIRSMLMNFDDVYQVEELLDKQLDGMKEEALHGSHALQNVADALPALGIVAAVLGVIKTMASIDKPPEVLGGMIGGALVGTFLGVFMAYSFVGPMATKIKAIREQEHSFYSLVREVLVSSLHKNETQICIEVARRSAPKHQRPSFTDIEEALKEASAFLAVAIAPWQSAYSQTSEETETTASSQNPSDEKEILEFTSPRTINARFGCGS